MSSLPRNTSTQSVGTLPTVRLHDPDGPARMGSAFLTLRQAWEEFHDPHWDGAASTRKEYRRALDKWELFTPNPAISAISDDDATALKKGMLEAGLEPPTIHKTWRTLSALFTTLVDRGLVARKPKMRKPKYSPGVPRLMHFRELSALYEACGVVDFRGHRGAIEKRLGPLMFRTAIVFYYACGLRRDDQWSLLWTQIDLERGVYRCTPKKTGREIERPIAPLALEHLKEWRRQVPRNWKRVFPVAHSTIERHWKLIRKKAGVSCTWHDLRRTCQTCFDEIHNGLGDWMLDHRKADVGSQYYRNMSRKAKWASRRLKMPKSFRTLKTPQLQLDFGD